MITLNKNMLFNEYLPYWLETYSAPNNRDTTIKNYRYTIMKHITPNLGHYRIEDLKTAVIQEYANSLIHYKKGTIVNIVKIIKNSLRVATDILDILPYNPSEKVFIPKNAIETHVSSMTDDEIIAVFKDTEKKDYGVPIRLGYLTGLRAGEACALSWENIDFENKMIYIKHGLTSLNKTDWRLSPPKTKTSVRSLPMHNELFVFLSDLKKKQESSEEKRGYHFFKLNQDGYIKRCEKEESNIRFVCAKPNGDFTHPVCLATNCNRVSKRLGFRFTFHMLRHTYATQLLENKASLIDISCRLGHASTETTTKIYLHRTAKIAEATNKILDENFLKIH